MNRKGVFRRSLAFMCAITLCLTLWAMHMPSFSVGSDEANEVGLYAPADGQPTRSILSYDNGGLKIEGKFDGDESQKSSEVQGNTALRWTGEPFNGTLGLSNTSVSNKSYRIYFEFSNPQAQLIVGSNTNKVEPGQTYDYQDNGQSITYSYHRVSETNTYYLDFQGSKINTTIVLPYSITYPSPQSPGGTVKIWGVANADAGEPAAQGTGDYLNASWDTERREYKVHKEPASLWECSRFDNWGMGEQGSDCNVFAEHWGDGKPVLETSNGTTYLNHVGFDITVEQGQLSEGHSINAQGSPGADFATEEHFTDTITLPVGVELDPQIVKNFAQGTYEWNDGDGGANSYYKIYKVQGVEVFRFRDDGAFQKWTCKTEDYDADYIEGCIEAPTISEDGKTITLKFIRKNRTTNAEIPPETGLNNGLQQLNAYYFAFADNVLKVPNPAEGVTYKVENTVSDETHYTHSQPATTAANAEVSAIIEGGAINVKKTHSVDNPYTGDSQKFTITVKNTDLKPASASVLIDPLPDMYKMDSADLAELFNDDKNGARATVKITGARICNYKTARTETLWNGDTAQTAPQQAGTIDKQRYTVKGSAHDPCKTGTDTITFTRNGDILTINAKSGSHSLKAPFTEKNIAQKLSTIGYIVDKAARYTVQWQIPNNAVEGLSTLTYTIPATVKDDFEYVQSDAQWKNNEAMQSTNIATLKTPDGDVQGSDTGVAAKHVWSIEKGGKILTSSKPFDNNPNTQEGVSVGDTINYTLDIKKNGGEATYSALPLSDGMNGPQVLLAPVALNPELAASGLPSITINDQQYYQLSRVGVYENVVFNATKNGEPTTVQADRVSVARNTDKVGGLLTVTHWYLDAKAYETNPSGADTLSVDYFSYIDPTATGYTGPVPFSNYMYLGDHETERIFDTAGEIAVARVGAGKRIVLDKKNEREFLDDATAVQSGITEGKTLTYRLAITQLNDGKSTTLTGADIYDALPKSLSTSPWKKADISVELPNGQKNIQSKTGDWNSSWNVSQQSPTGTADAGDAEQTQQFLTWPASNTLTITGDIYFYVTLHFPSGDLWDTYEATYMSETLRNTLHVRDPEEGQDRVAAVTHFIGGQESAQLQKGVIRTGYVENPYGLLNLVDHVPDTSVNGRNLYTNASNIYENQRGQKYGGHAGDTNTRYGYATYYVVLNNSGETRLYVNDIQDVLPEGFFFAGYTQTNGETPQWHRYNVHDPETNEVIGYTVNMDTLSQEGPYVWLTDSSEKPVTITGATDTAVKATIHANPDPSNPRHVTFTVDGELEGSTISFDSETGKYYLNPGETLAFCYIANAGTVGSTKDYAENTVAMPYTKIGNGTPDLNSPTSGVQIVSHDFEKNSKNDGTRSVASTESLREDDFIGGTPGQTWLTSNVGLKRENIAPGLQKTLASKVSTGSTVDNPENAGYSDILNWEIVATNNSLTPISNYVMSDVFSPYEVPTGELRIKTEQPITGTDPVEYRPALLPSFENEKQPEEEKILTFEEPTYQTNSDGTVKLTSIKVQYRKPGYGERSADLHVDGAPLTVEAGGTSIRSHYQVGLASTDDGKVRLDVHLLPDLTLADHPAYHTERLSYGADIPAQGGRAVLKVSTKDPDGTGIYRLVANQAYLTPLDQSFKPSDVKAGSVTTQDAVTNSTPAEMADGKFDIKHEYKDMPSILAEAIVPISTDAYTSSVLHVLEKSDPENTANSVSTPNYIELGGQRSIFTYQMDVKNVKDSAITQFVAINNLSYEGDNYTFDEGPERLSEFGTKFATQPNPTVQILPRDADSGDPDSWETLDPSKYVIEYSNKRSGFTDTDWSGGSSGWSAQPSANSRSLRVRLVDGYALPGGATIRTSFDAQVDSESSPKVGEIAWNTFGYRYIAPGTTNLAVESIPLKVGVKYPDVPPVTIDKVLMSGNMYAGIGTCSDSDTSGCKAADEDQTYRFILYKSRDGKQPTFAQTYGDAASTLDKANLAADSTTTYTLPQADDGDICRAVSNANFEFTILEVTVPAGEHKGTVSTRDLSIYTCSGTDMNVQWKNTGEPWEWEAPDASGHAPGYGIAEIPSAALEYGMANYRMNQIHDGKSTIANSQYLTFWPWASVQLHPEGIHVEAFNQEYVWPFYFQKADGDAYDAAQWDTSLPGVRTVSENSPVENEDIWLNGAVFGVYSPNPDDAVAQCKADNGMELMPADTVDTTTEFGGHTYYLAACKADNSLLQLSESNYLYKELKAPQGYEPDPEYHQVFAPYLRSDQEKAGVYDTSAHPGFGLAGEVVKNYKAYELPKTGRFGLWPFALVGLAMVGGAYLHLLYRRKRAWR